MIISEKLINVYISVLQIFVGNMDNDGTKTNLFDPPIIAQFIRIVPVVCRKACTLRMELVGCELNGKVPAIFLHVYTFLWIDLREPKDKTTPLEYGNTAVVLWKKKWVSMQHHNLHNFLLVFIWGELKDRSPIWRKEQSRISPNRDSSQ